MSDLSEATSTALRRLALGAGLAPTSEIEKVALEILSEVIAKKGVLFIHGAIDEIHHTLSYGPAFMPDAFRALDILQRSNLTAAMQKAEAKDKAQAAAWFRLVGNALGKVLTAVIGSVLEGFIEGSLPPNG